MANAVVAAINTVIRAINTINFTVPDWIPGVGGNSVGFNIPEINKISIPRLATGAVIPANKEFLAVLGDQKHGTNIEAPLEMIKQANKEGLLEILNQLGLPSGGGGQEINLNLTVECDGHQLLHLMQKLNREYFKQTGRNAFIY